MSYAKLITTEMMYVGVSLIGFGVGATIYTSETFFVDRHVKRNQKKISNKEPYPVSAELDIKLKDVKTDLSYDEILEPCVKLYITRHFDLTSNGSGMSRKGIRIGIPETFECKTLDDIKKKSMKIKGQLIDLNSSDGEKLAKTFLLSNRAQKFILAKEIEFRDGGLLLFLCSLPIVSGICIGHIIEKGPKYLKKYPDGIRWLIYGLACVAILSLHYYVHNQIVILYDQSSLCNVLEMGERYVIGSIEYYKKLTERNKLLRNMIQDGNKYYDENGNFRKINQIPLTVKKFYSEQIYEKHYKVNVKQTEVLSEN